MLCLPLLTDTGERERERERARAFYAFGSHSPPWICGCFRETHVRAGIIDTHAQASTPPLPPIGPDFGHLWSSDMVSRARSVLTPRFPISAWSFSVCVIRDRDRSDEGERERERERDVHSGKKWETATSCTWQVLSI